MEKEILNASSVSQINQILIDRAGEYDLDMIILSKEGVGVGMRKGIISTPLVGGVGSTHEHTGRDEYYIESSEKLDWIKDLVVKSIRLRK